MDRQKEQALREQAMHLDSLKADPGWDLVHQRLKRLEQDYQSQCLQALELGDQSKAMAFSNQRKTIKMVMELPGIMSAEIQNALRRTKE